MPLGSRMARALKPTTYTIRYRRKMPGNTLLYVSSASASLGDALLGYSQGITAAFQIQPAFIHRIYGKHVTYKQIMHATTGVQALQPAILIASLSVTAIFAALASAYISDGLGRRTAIRIGAMLYLIASAIQMIAPDLPILIVGRSIQGLGAGILSTTVPVFQVEIAPAGARGMLVGLEALCMNAGYAAAAWVGLAISLVLIVWTFFLPESPRWLIQNGFTTEGLWTLADLHAHGDVTDEGVNQTYYAIVDTLEMEKEKAGGRRVRRAPALPAPHTHRAHRAHVRTAQRINAVLHFLPEHLAEAGFRVHRALFFAGCCSLLYSLGTLPAILFIDKLGPAALPHRRQRGTRLYVDHWPRMLAYLGGARGVFIGMGMYLFFFGATWGPVPWLLSAELYPLRMRAKGMSINAASDWFFECVVGVATPPLFSLFGGGYYLLLAGACMLSGVAVWLAYVETGGRPLEAVGGIFGDGCVPPRKLELEDAVLQCAAVASASTRRPLAAPARRGPSQATLHFAAPEADDHVPSKRPKSVADTDSDM
ncbi:general substrate transporter [Mycena olivaceomarginata]|nr:general substrate transporter [Mycena olivaceomarginata]